MWLDAGAEATSSPRHTEQGMSDQMRLAVLASIVLVGVLLSACGSSQTVRVSMSEWSLTVDDESISSGAITFKPVLSRGFGDCPIGQPGGCTVSDPECVDFPCGPHELVVVKTNLRETELPRLDNGALDETGEGVIVTDRLFEFTSDDRATLSTKLEPGNYVLLCNLVEQRDGETVSHFQRGMFTFLRVD